MIEKFKNPLQKCSRCNKREAPVIGIQREQKASCGLVSPAPRPLPLPQSPWQRENIWESAQEPSIKLGGRPITRPQRSGPARSTPPGFCLFINSHLLLLHREAEAGLTQPTTRIWFHFPSHSPAASCRPPHSLRLLQFPPDTHLAPRSPLPARLPGALDGKIAG